MTRNKRTASNRVANRGFVGVCLLLFLAVGALSQVAPDRRSSFRVFTTETLALVQKCIATSWTREQVSFVAGPPEYVQRFANDIEVWRYRTNSEFLLVAFNRYGVVEVSRRPISPNPLRTEPVKKPNETATIGARSPMIPAHRATGGPMITSLKAVEMERTVQPGWKIDDVVQFAGPPTRFDESGATATMTYASPASEVTITTERGAVVYVIKTVRRAPTPTALDVQDTTSSAGASAPTNVTSMDSGPSVLEWVFEKLSAVAEASVSAQVFAKPAPAIIVSRREQSTSRGDTSGLKECSSDYQCGFGRQCVKPAGSISLKGVCVAPVDNFGTKIITQPVPSPGPHTVSGCSFTTDCPIGFSCVKQGGHLQGLCIKK
jgi:hypothetical protein